MSDFLGFGPADAYDWLLTPEQQAMLDEELELPKVWDGDQA